MKFSLFSPELQMVILITQAEKQTHVLRSTHFRVSLDRGSDFDREIGKSFSPAAGEIGTFMVIIFSLLLAFYKYVKARPFYG